MPRGLDKVQTHPGKVAHAGPEDTSLAWVRTLSGRYPPAED